MEMIIYRKGEPFTVLYDECDHDLVSGYKWIINVYGYVMAYRKGLPVLMHRLIAGTPKGLLTDHKNRVKHDNRRCNLRICTGEQNVRNRKNDPSTKYQGVSKIKSSGRYLAQIGHNGKTIKLGTFELEMDALRAYDSAANFYFGEFALLNFPDETPKEFVEPTRKERRKKALISQADLAGILREKHLLKSKLLPGEITKAANKIGKPPSYISSWFSLNRPDKRDKEYKAAIKKVISIRNAMFRRLINS